MAKTILIVEDDPFIAMDLQDTFENAGYEVLGPIASVDRGMKILRETKPDVAMLDYNLGRETSIPLAKKLDEIETPYIFLSGQIDRVITSYTDTPKIVIAKPFNASGLIACIEGMINMNRV